MRPAPSFVDDRRGVSAIEFALVFPVLVVLLLAGVQLVMYINAVRRVEMVANSISEMISQSVPPTSSDTAKVSSLDLHFAYDATLVLFPYIMTDAAAKKTAWWQDITIDFAGIEFVGNGKACGSGPDQSACFDAKVRWTSTGTVGLNARPCAPYQTPVDDNATTTNATLPRSLYGSGSVIAIDVLFTFTPTFGASLLPSIKIARSAFVQPRYAEHTTYDALNDNDGIATLCPGFT